MVLVEMFGAGNILGAEKAFVSVAESVLQHTNPLLIMESMDCSLVSLPGIGIFESLVALCTRVGHCGVVATIAVSA